MEKKKLVLHICCAPDEAWVIKKLMDEYDLYCFFCNPNVQPEQEYLKRLADAEKVSLIYNVPFEADEYLPESWEQSIKGYEHTSEGGERCDQCFMLRLRRTAAFCKKIGWPAFTTVMSISPHKKIEMLNRCGKAAGSEHGIVYENFDFKKNNGFLGSIQLSRELGLYRQDYCGCRLSREERKAQKKTKKKIYPAK